MNIGRIVQQPTGYPAFIPDKFLPDGPLVLNAQTQQLHARAVLMVGKLDGITQLLPDLDSFIFMYITKEAARSSEIEGTQATIVDVLKSEADLEHRPPQDVERILRYIQAMEYGLKRLEALPLSLRFIREIHRVLLEETVDAFGKTPGEFRTSQNWVGGGSPTTARFMPPTPAELPRCLDDFEKFLYLPDRYPPLIQAALAHAQFETLYPFLDGNGRTGRLLTTFNQCKLGLLERPVLYLSDYFLRHRQSYYDSLETYHREGGELAHWLDFFLEGVVQIAEEAIQVSKQINLLRQEDLAKIQTLGRRAKSAVLVLNHLYRLPIVSVYKVEE